MSTVDFQKVVLEASRNQPIVVDFWAPWCGPCQFLTPVLEDLAKDAQGQWSLVKVNIDENPVAAKQYAVRGIPDVRMFHHSKSIAAFTGSLPKHRIASWLEEHLPNPVAEELQHLQKAYADRPKEEYSEALEKFVEENQDFATAKVLLAIEKIWTAPHQAQSLIGSIKLGHKEFERAEQVRELSRLMLLEEEGQPSVYSVLMAAKSAFQSGDMELGVEKLIESVSIDKEYQEDLPRKATIALFRILGEKHPLTQEYRRVFDRTLY